MPTVPNHLLQRPALKYPMPHSGHCRDLYSQIHCPSLSPAGTCKQVLLASFWFLQAPIIPCPLPYSVTHSQQHSHAHCPSLSFVGTSTHRSTVILWLPRHLHSHDHYPIPQTLLNHMHIHKPTGTYMHIGKIPMHIKLNSKSQGYPK